MVNISKILDLKILEVEEKEIDKINDLITDQIDIISISNPSKKVVNKLLKKGYFYVPVKVRYVLDAPKDKESYLKSLKRNRRKRILRAFRDCEKENIRIFVEDPLSFV